MSCSCMWAYVHLEIILISVCIKFILPLILEFEYVRFNILMLSKMQLLVFFFHMISPLKY